MKRNTDLANRVREVLLNGKWIANTNFKEQIQNTTWQHAIQKVENLNTIALLTFHINYYLGGILKVLHGGNLDIKDQYSFDLNEITTEVEWNTLINEFIGNAEALVNHIQQMPESLLDDIFVDPKYGTYARNIEGIIEHSYYHLGQVSLIIKLIQ